MNNQPPLNPDALDNLATVVFGFDIEEWNEHDEDEKRQLLAPYIRTIETYLAAALPEVTSVPGVYDLGAPEPVGVDQVIECDEFGEPDERGDSANEPTWSKTTDGTRWKGYKDGKEYRTWDDLVRRYGPLTEYRPEVKP